MLRKDDVGVGVGVGVDADALPTDLQPVKEFLTNALHRKAQNEDSSHYKHLVDQLKSRDDPETLWRIYLGLQSCLSMLMKEPEKFKDLINALYSYDWLMEAKINKALIRLLSTFISANSLFLLPTFQMVIKSLVNIPITYDLVPSAKSTMTSKSPLCIQQQQQQQQPQLVKLLHDFLRYVITTVPTGLPELIPVLISNFPYKKQAVEILTNYVKELLCICEYLPVLQPKILELIIQRCLEIDVEIYIEDTGEVSIHKNLELNNDYNNNNNENEGGVFELDVDIQHQQDVTNAPFTETNQHIAAEVQDSAEKLDAMLVLIIEFIDKHIDNSRTGCGSSSSSSSSSLSSSIIEDNSDGDRLFCQLVAIFEDNILLAHRSKFVQFILFYICSKVEKYAVLFTKKLVQMFMDDKNSLWKRQCSMVYLASYCARANYIPLALIRDVLFQLIEWADVYVINSKTSQLPVVDDNKSVQSKSDVYDHDYGYNYDCNDLDEFGRLKSRQSTDFASSSSTYTSEQRGRHETFFCCMQASCYIVCFHGIDMVMSQKTNNIIKTKWERTISSSLNPLKFCLCSVRYEFLRLANYTELFRQQVWTLIPNEIKNDFLQGENEEGGDDNNDNNSSNDNNNDNNDNNDNKQPDIVAVSIIVPGSRPKPTKTISAMAGQVLRGVKANPLESFFPFDPCLLRMLYSHLESDYRPWQGLPGLDLDNELNDGEFIDYDDLSLDYDMDESNDMDMSSMYSGSSGTSLSSSLQLQSTKQQGYGSYMSNGNIDDGTDEGSNDDDVDDDDDNEQEGAYGDNILSLQSSLAATGGIAFGNGNSNSNSNSNGNTGVFHLPIRKPRAFSISSTGSW